MMAFGVVLGRWQARKAAIAQAQYNQIIAYRNWLGNAPRYDAPSRIPKARRK